MKSDENDIPSRKHRMRQEIRSLRKSVLDKKTRSRRIFHHLRTLECWKTAKNVLVYLHIHSEVETDLILEELLWQPGLERHEVERNDRIESPDYFPFPGDRTGVGNPSPPLSGRSASFHSAPVPAAIRKCVIPWCHEDGELRLFHLISPEEELSPGTLGIREPTDEWKQHPHRHVPPEHLDLILLPGIAFDKTGRRLGQGRAFYDRLLAQATRATTVGLAFSCQIVEEVPWEPHDRVMDFVITEEEIFHR